MDIQTVTVGLPVSDIDSAVRWYRKVFELGAPELEPAAGVVEFQLGTIWLQLGADTTDRSGAEVVTRFGVADVRTEYIRLQGLGVELGALQHVPGAVDYVDFTDPDGNVLSIYTELSPA